MADVDVVVIGSGAGGLAAALALARAGKKVVVLEQHYLPGGWCHTFPLGGYRFSPGVHYIGELGPGGRSRQIYEGLGVSGDIEFCELNPDGFDHVLIAGERFDIPKGKKAFGERLKARFPMEKAGIDAYLDTVSRLAGDLDGMVEVKGVLDILSLPFKAPTLARWGLRTAEALINGHVKDPVLRGILAAQSGDHGLPPSMAPAPVHAAVAAHYFNGGFYPRGGGFAIPRAFILALRRAGGEIRMRAEVSAILLEGRRAIGVRLADGTEIRAKTIVSNADPEITYRRLIGASHLSGGLRRKLDKTKWSVSALSLFMAAEFDARALGLDSGNYWFYKDADVEGTYKKEMEAWNPESDIPGFFLTVTTLKDPSKMKHGAHTMEAFTFIGADAFKKWAGSAYGERPADYAVLKERLKQKMITAVEQIIPGLRDKLVFSDLGTPLTNKHFVAATAGNLYGIEKNRWQVGPWSYQVRSEFEGLYLCGSSTLSHGVMGATISGLIAAREILGGRLDDLLDAKGPPIRIYPSDDVSAWPESLRRRMAQEGRTPAHA